MSDAAFKILPAALRRWMEQLFLRKVVLFTSRRVDMLGETTDDPALVAVVGREHYEPTYRKYPIRGRSDLSRVLRLEFPAGFPGEFMFAIGPLLGDEREVEIFRLLPGCPREQLRAAFWIPESQLLRSLVKAEGVAVVQRDGLEYFVAATGLSSVSGGLIRSPELFALAVGAADSRIASQPVDHARLLTVIPESCKDLGIVDWWSFRSPVAVDTLVRFLKPAAAFSAAVLVVYLTAVSAFLWGMESYRARQLERLGPEVTTLLAKQRALDLMAAERAGIADLLDASAPAWPLWEVASAVWRARGIIHSLILIDDRVTIRCTAPDATDVLAALRALKGLSEVEFESAVRQGLAGQDFSVSFVRQIPAQSKRK